MPQGIQNEPIITVQGPTTGTPVAPNASDVVVTNAKGRCFSILVTATGANPLQVFDNPAAGSGTMIAALPASPGLGLYAFNTPAATGITVKGSATNPAIVVFWSGGPAAGV